jgi:hypothetical protein
MASCMVMCGAHALRGLSWPLPEGMDDEGLELLLFPAPTAASQSDRRPVPDWVYVEKELRRRSVTRLLLWEEYRAANPLANFQRTLPTQPATPARSAKNPLGGGTASHASSKLRKFSPR